MIVVEIASRARVPIAALGDVVTRKIRAAFTHANIKRITMEAAKIRGFWNEPRQIATWGGDDEYLTLPRGGMKRLRRILAEAGIEFRLRDMRAAGIPLDVGESVVDPWPHQERIVEACLRRENCLIKSGTGSGKTSALLAFVGRAKVSTLVIVHSNALLDQWAERAVSELGLRSTEVGMLGGGKHRVEGLTIGTQKSVAIAAEDPEFRSRWGAVLCDEVHCFAASTFFACVDPFPARYRIGASDDQKRKDRKEFLVHDLFGEVEEEVTDTELVDGGHVMPVEVLVVPTEFRADWYGVPTDEDDAKRPEFGRLLQEMTQDPERRALVERVMATEIAEKRQILAMADSRDYCRELAAFASRSARAGHLIGGQDFRAEFKRTKDGMKAGKIQVGVGTFQATGTGIDIPGVEIVICATPVLANKSRFRQGRGRAMRRPAGKTIARMYVTWDRHVYGLRHLANAASWNENTYVWEAGKWIPAKEYLRRERAAERARTSDG